MLCQKAHEECGNCWNGELPKETIGHIQSAGCLGQKEVGTLWDQEECNQFCSKGELWAAARDEEMKIPLQEANEGPPVPEEQYQERFWRRRLDGIGLDTATKEFQAIEFKRTQDARSNYVERATAVAQKQYKSLLMSLQAVGQVKGWKVQQIVFVIETCGSIHVESFNRNMKALGSLRASGTPFARNS